MAAVLNPRVDVVDQAAQLPMAFGAAVWLAFESRSGPGVGTAGEGRRRPLPGQSTTALMEP